MSTFLTKTGDLEKEEAIAILKAIIDNGYPDGFDLDGVVFNYDDYNQIVSLINSSRQKLVVDDGKLYFYYQCPICGKEKYLDSSYQEKDFFTQCGNCTKEEDYS